MSESINTANHVNYAGGGYFMYGNKKLNANDMNNLLQYIYRAGLNVVLQDKFQEVNEQSNRMQALTDMLQFSRTAKTTKDKPHDDSNTQDKSDPHGGQGEMFALAGQEGKHSFEGWCEELGIEATDVDPNDDKKEWEKEWQDNIDNVKSELDQVQSISQETMLQYKQTMGYHDNSVSEQSQSQTMFQQLWQKLTSG